MIEVEAPTSLDLVPGAFRRRTLGGFSRVVGLLARTTGWRGAFAQQRIKDCWLRRDLRVPVRWAIPCACFTHSDRAPGVLAPGREQNRRIKVYKPLVPAAEADMGGVPPRL